MSNLVKVSLPPPVVDDMVHSILSKLRGLGPSTVSCLVLATTVSVVFTSISAGAIRTVSVASPTLCMLTPPFRHLGA